MNNHPKIIALYLPQFYETDYNNMWWGKGYTEWTACKNAHPLFKGHNQPRIPLNNNYYNLASKETISWQIDLAKKYGIDGFAIYHYYSVGNKLLETPTEIIRDDQDLSIPFFLYWANESWKKAWFGQDNSIVWEQLYGNEDDWKKHFNYCLQYFKDKRYISIDNKPIFAIYNAWAIPQMSKMIELWNKWAVESGLNGIYFVKTLNRHESSNKGEFNAVATREPNNYFAKYEPLTERIIRVIKSRTAHYINTVYLFKHGKGIVSTLCSYDKIWKRILSREINEKNVIFGAFCDWDNSPRKSYNSIVFQGATPEKFSFYLKALLKKSETTNCRMVLINAWNEWAEGAYLEPDTKNGYSYLEAVKNAKEQI